MKMARRRNLVIVDDANLTVLVQVLNNSNYRLGLNDVEPDILGRAYE